MVDRSGETTHYDRPLTRLIFAMGKLLKILFLPLWLPFKILWVISKVLALLIMILLIAALIYIALHFF
jgi:hypothetical protein